MTAVPAERIAFAPPIPTLIESPEGVAALCEVLRRCDRLSVDTETNGLHAYRSRVCVIQVSDGRNVWLVDVIALGSEADAAPAIAPLLDVLEDPKILKILHGASHDVASLKEDFGRGIKNIFDTYVAAQFLNYEKNGLASVVEKHCNVKVGKELQKADWGRRPLEADSIAYLMQDVLYLHTVHDLILGELAASDILEEAAIESKRIEDTEATGSSFNPDGFWKMKGSEDLEGEQLALLKRLYALRDRIAGKQNRPAFKVIPDPVLVECAKASSSREIGRIRFFSRPSMREWMGEFTREFHASRGENKPGREARRAGRRHHGEIAPRQAREKIEAAVKDWRKKEAESRKISTMAVLPNYLLETVVFNPPQTLHDLAALPNFGSARLRRYGTQLIDLTNNVPESSQTASAHPVLDAERVLLGVANA